MAKFYLTTPIYYVNDKPHLGSMYTTVAADALAVWHRLKGEETFLLTGVDENSQKTIQAMEKTGETDLRRYLDQMAKVWRSTWAEFGISFDDFIRTTEERHLKGVERFWKAVEASGDLYLGTYEGLYCVGCEGFKTESDLTDGRCPLHPTKELDRIKEQNYFFRLSAYRDRLLALYENQPSFILPEARRNEIRNYVTDHLTDISVSREAASSPAGIPVPLDDSQRIYVWFDALLNYLTAVGYGTDEALFRRYWPADLHLMGKDIIKFHAALWPAMIMSAAASDPLLRDTDNQPLLPKSVFAHGFFTLNGQKMSKSLGNVLDPHEVVKKHGLDAVRYFLLREISFGEDGDFSETRLRERYAADLGNTFGNLVQRVVSMSRNYFNGSVPTVDPAQAEEAEKPSLSWLGKRGLEELTVAVQTAYDEQHCDVALEKIWNGFQSQAGSGLIQANKYIEETQPFKLVKTDAEATGRILYSLLEACRWYAWMIYPVMPATAQRVWEQLGINAEEERAKLWEKALKWGQLAPGQTLPEPKPLFPRSEEV